MTRPLSVDVDDVTSRSGIHDRVAAALSQLTGATPDPAGLQNAYGPVSAALVSALADSLPQRDDSLDAARETSETVGDLLRRAADAYARGDEVAAERFSAAAEVVAGRAGVGSAGVAVGYPGDGSGVAAVGTPPAGGPEMAGQLAGQVGQQVGQVVQGLAQSVQGLVQGLVQLPQQLARSVDDPSTAAGARDDGESEDLEDPDDRNGGDEEDRDGEPESEPRESTPRPQAEGARPGQTGEPGPAPEPAPVPERPRPVQTRPQQAPF